MKKSQNGPLIVGHRGASVSAPENTIAAFRAAIDAGAEGIEFDVRLARDGVPVVFHDSTLSRIAGIKTPVAKLTSAELSRVDAGSWFDRASGNGPKFSKETISTLAEVLEFLGSFDGRIFVELKCGENDVEHLTAAVCGVIAGSHLRDQLIVKSFRLEAIPRIRALCPGIRTAALFAPKIMTLLRKEKHLVKLAYELGADELSIHTSLATRKLMEKAGKRGLPVNVWTADNPRWAKRGIRLGLKSIITNDPGSLLARRTELEAAGA